MQCLGTPSAQLHNNFNTFAGIVNSVATKMALNTAHTLTKLLT